MHTHSYMHTYTHTHTHTHTHTRTHARTHIYIYIYIHEQIGGPPNLHDKLMSARNEGKTVTVVELSAYILAKRVTSPSRGYAPACALIRIRPEKITHGTFVRDL